MNAIQSESSIEYVLKWEGNFGISMLIAELAIALKANPDLVYLEHLKAELESIFIHVEPAMITSEDFVKEYIKYRLSIGEN